MVVVVAFLSPFAGGSDDQSGDSQLATIHASRQQQQKTAPGEASGMQLALPANPEHDHPALAICAAGPHAAEVDVRIVNSQLPVPELLKQLSDVDAISAYNGVFLGARQVAWPMPSATELADKLPRLKVVQMTSAGYNALDIEALAERGVTVCNNGGANAKAVAEHAMSLILALSRNLIAMTTNVETGIFTTGIDVKPIRELAGQTVGIVGFGNIGRQLARRLAGFGVRLIYFDVVKLLPGRDGELLAEQAASLEELLQASDIISLHVPLLSTTVGMIGKAEFSNMKRGATLINTSRGAVVQEQALVDALDDGQLGAAGLDVFEREPLGAGHPLLGRSNVLLTPHLAGVAAETFPRAIAFAVENMARLAKGEELMAVVPPEQPPSRRSRL